MARPAKRGEEAAFEQNGAMRRRVVDGLQQRERRGVALARRDPHRTLRARRQHHIVGNRRADFESQPVEPGGGEQRRIDRAIFDFGHPRRDIAAQHRRFEIGPHCLQLRGTARARRADPAPKRQCGDALGPQQPFADISARQHGDERNPVAQLRLDVLHRMHRKVDPPVEQRRVELLGPQRLTADLGKRPVLHPVAGGRDDDDLDRVDAPAMRGSERLRRHPRLRQRQRRTARSEFELGIHRRRLC